MKRHVLLFVAVVTLMRVSTADAVPITYTQVLTASGSFGGTAFIDALVTLELVADTNTVVVTDSGLFYNFGPASVDIDGVGSATFSGPDMRVVDNPIESPEACFVRSGIRRAAVEAGANVYLPSEGDFELLNVPGATHIESWPFFWRPFHGANKVIGVAPVKDHNLCRASMTTKNWYGLLGGRRNQFHQDIHGIISDLALMMRPTFVLLDGSRVLFRSGPTGGSLSDVRPGHTIVASTDTLAADAFGWDDLLARKGEDLPDYFRRAASRGLGTPDWRSVPVKEQQVG